MIIALTFALSLAAAPPPPPQPPVTEGLRVHLRADSLKLDDGDEVTVWPDLATTYIERDKAQDAGQAYRNPPGFPGGAPRPFEPLDPPTFVADAEGTPAVRFDGEQQTGLSHFNGIGLRGTDGGDAMTLVLVLRNTGKPGVARAVQVGDIEGTGEDGGPASSVAVDVNTAPQAGFGTRFQNGNQLTSDPLPQGWCVVTVVLDAGETYGETRVIFNGRTPDLAGATNPENQLRLRDEGYCLGYGNTANGAANDFFTGDIAEFLYYQRALDDEDLQRLHEDLLSRYPIPQPN